jgi:predicted NUDIX family phosphoesterase
MEFVYVVKRADLFDLSFPHGFVARAAGDPADRVATWTRRIRERAFFVERRWAEKDSSLKQVIPYTLLVHGDEIFLLRRTSKGGEARLHGKLSIGVGGHINPVDLDGADVLDAGCRRELEEEVDIRTPYALTTVGVINDDSSDVGSVHFGLVNVARCEVPDVAVRETEVLEGGFVARAALREMATTQRDRFETWSALIVDRLDDALAAARGP